jgi:hypothetical protein
MRDCDPNTAMAARLWFTGRDGPYSDSQWEAIRCLVVAHIQRCFEAARRCEFRQTDR